jgi:hypothetical protein
MRTIIELCVVHNSVVLNWNHNVCEVGFACVVGDGWGIAAYSWSLVVGLVSACSVVAVIKKKRLYDVSMTG